ncbi:MAG TPA: DUF1501 domain-containing protein, partial [Armatimonadota bacterium]|nr:DUF1501 domain-containing protein [Armatimonadota bacterium]
MARPCDQKEKLSPAELQLITRRHFFERCGVGVGTMALASLLRDGDIYAAQAAPKRDPQGAQAADPLAVKQPHFAPKAKAVIYLFMAGAPSQLDLFDYKPKLTELHGQPLPPSVTQGQRFAFIKGDAKVLGTPRKFAKHGKSGAEISDALPHLTKVADDIAIVRSMTTDAFNHAPAEIFLMTGSTQFGRPSMGSWLTYGLGSETRDLPAFVVLSSGGGTASGAANWGSGFLPTIYQGVPFRSQGDPILFLSNPKGIDARAQ